jgi:flagellar basal-body rod protein FlgC
MSLFKIFDVAGSALSAQSVRLNTIASNLANAENASSTPEGVYRARHPVFAAVLNEAGRAEGAAVRVVGILESDEAPVAQHLPGHPMADAEGNVWFSSVNPIEEMTDLMSAESTYRNNVEMIDTVKQLMLRTLQIGRR